MRMYKALNEIGSNNGPEYSHLEVQGSFEMTQDTA